MALFYSIGRLVEFKLVSARRTYFVELLGTGTRVACLWPRIKLFVVNSEANPPDGVEQ